MRTFNRMPITVGTPSSSDIKTYTENMYEFSGLIDDKNFLAVDQKSFADCNNVYVDEEGLLHSRPSIKKKNAPVNNIDDIWVFDNVTVYRNGYTLLFVNKGINTTHTITIEYNTPKVILMEKRIFVFSKNSTNKWYWYDTQFNISGTLDTSNFVYVPTTSVVTNGVLESKKDLDSPNVLTTAYKTEYVYTSIVDANFEPLVGGNDRVDITINGNTYRGIQWSEGSELTLGKEFSMLRDEQYRMTSNDVVGTNANFHYFRINPVYNNVEYKQSAISVGRNGTVLIPYYTYDSNTHTVKWEAYYTLNGSIKHSILDDLPAEATIYGIPKISHDGNYVAVLLSFGNKTSLYVKSIYNETYTGKLFETWTDVVRYLNDDIVDGQFVIDQNTDVKSNYLCYDFDIETYDRFCFVSKNTSRQTILFMQNGDTHSSKMVNDLTTRYFNNKYYISDKYCVYIEYSDILRAVVYDLNTFTSHYINMLDGPNSLILDKCNDISIENDVLRITVRTDSSTVVIASANLTTYTYLDEMSYQYIGKAPAKLIDGNNIAGGSIRYNRHIVTFLQDNVYTVYASGKTLYYISNNILYSTNVQSTNEPFVTITKTTDGTLSNFAIQHSTILSDYYFTRGNTLYVTDNRKVYNVYVNNNYNMYASAIAWYIPEVAVKKFDEDIVNVHPISASEIAIFFENSIYYKTYDNNLNGYRYYKAKIDVGCNKNCDVITTYDGKYVIFPSKRGLVAMTYQEFMATSEQTLTYLSDNIVNVFKQYTERAAVKLFKYLFWIVVYRQDTSSILLFDMRNNSWWPMSCSNKAAKKLIEYNNHIYLILSDNLLHYLDTSENNYYDDGNEKIQWFVKSQKLFLGAANYYKHICNMVFTTVHDADETNMLFKVNAGCYRRQLDILEEQYRYVEYKVSAAKTYVLRLNYSKVNEFEYYVESDLDSFKNIPFSVSNISVKYKIGGQVR